jgi:hypothetical protein
MSENSSSKNRHRMSSATRKKWDKKDSKTQDDKEEIKDDMEFLTKRQVIL